MFFLHSAESHIRPCVGQVLPFGCRARLKQWGPLTIDVAGRQTAIELAAFVFMPEHVHLLVVSSSSDHESTATWLHRLEMVECKPAPARSAQTAIRGSSLRPPSLRPRPVSRNTRPVINHNPHWRSQWRPAKVMQFFSGQCMGAARSLSSPRAKHQGHAVDSRRVQPS